MSMFIVQVHINMVKTLSQGFQYAPAVWKGFLAFENVSTDHRVSLVPWGTLQIRIRFVR